MKILVTTAAVAAEQDTSHHVSQSLCDAGPPFPTKQVKRGIAGNLDRNHLQRVCRVNTESSNVVARLIARLPAIFFRSSSASDRSSDVEDVTPEKGPS